MRISDWSSDVCSSDLLGDRLPPFSFKPMAMERFESASSEHGIPIDEARRLVRTSVDRWNEEVLREFAHPEPSPARVRSLKGVLNSLRHRSEEHTSELQSLMRISYAVFCLKKNKTTKQEQTPHIKHANHMS